MNNTFIGYLTFMKMARGPRLEAMGGNFALVPIAYGFSPLACSTLLALSTTNAPSL